MYRFIKYQFTLLQIVGIHQTSTNGAQQIENPDTTANGVQYAVCNIVRAKDAKEEKEVCVYTYHKLQKF